MALAYLLFINMPLLQNCKYASENDLKYKWRAITWLLPEVGFMHSDLLTIFFYVTYNLWVQQISKYSLYKLHYKNKHCTITLLLEEEVFAIFYSSLLSTIPKLQVGTQYTMVWQICLDQILSTGILISDRGKDERTGG